MNNYKALEAYAIQLLEDISEARRIIEEVISDAIGLKIGSEKLAAFCITSVRNKCMDHNRLMASLEIQAAALGVSIGTLQQAKRAIREGRYLQ